MARADTYLVEKKYFESRAKAAAAIKAGCVLMDGTPLRKPSQNIPKGAKIEASAPHSWVSRAGLKLEHALTEFGVDPRGHVCLDVGASTGGFTEVLLARGAVKVYAVDVGREQLHERLKRNKRVISMEGTDARGLKADNFDPLPDFIVCDASFISITKCLGDVLTLAPNGAKLVTLIKPQFEVGRDNIGRGGIVRPEAPVDDIISSVVKWIEGQGWTAQPLISSPILGGSGNAEFLCFAEKIKA